MARAMAGLSSESLVRVSKLVGLEGTGEKFRTPLFYKAIMSVAPPLVRSISNVRYVGLDRIPSSGPAILAGNHTSHIDPIVNRSDRQDHGGSQARPLSREGGAF